MVKPDTALALFGLQHYEVIYEPISETLGVVGWGGPGSRRIVLSFRGTSNMQVGAPGGWVDVVGGQRAQQGHPGRRALLCAGVAVPRLGWVVGEAAWGSCLLQPV